MTRIEWTEPAVADLENIQDYIARDSADSRMLLLSGSSCPLISLNRFRKAAGAYLNRRIPRSGSFLLRATE
jgi:plasmid stabilization system protein ParE